MKLAAIAKLIKADGYCKLYKVFYDDCRTYDLYIGTKTAIFPLTGFPKAQNESELATLLGISKKEWADIEFDNDCPDDLHHIEGMDLDDTADGEMDCVTGRIGIRYCGCELVPMIEPVSGTVGFVDAKQIMPVADEIRKSGYFKSMESEICARSATKCTAKRWIVFMKVADMEGKTDNSQKKEEHDSLKPARDAIATAMRAAQFAKATGTPLPKPLKWQREFYDATGVFPYGWYECPVCGYRTDWEPHACPICHTLLEP